MKTGGCCGFFQYLAKTGNKHGTSADIERQGLRTCTEYVSHLIPVFEKAHKRLEVDHCSQGHIFHQWKCYSRRGPRLYSTFFIAFDCVAGLIKIMTRANKHNSIPGIESFHVIYRLMNCDKETLSF